MSAQTSNLSYRPLPHLPLELKHHILRFCDPSTLASTSLLSLAFLQLASPLLYRDIELIGLERAEELFCSRDKRVSQPQLDPYLSLHHLHTFTIVATFQTGGHLHLSTDRLPPPSSSNPSSILPALPVDFLTLRPIGINPCDLSDQEEELDRWDSLTRLLDPTIVHVQGLPPSAFNPHQIPRLQLAYLLWPNLTSLFLTNVVFDGLMTLWLLAGPSEGKSLTISFDLTEGGRWGDESYQARLRREGVVEEMCPPVQSAGTRIKEIVVLVGGEKEKERVEDEVLEGWKFQEVERRREFMKLVRFEVVVGENDHVV